MVIIFMFTKNVRLFKLQSSIAGNRSFDQSWVEIEFFMFKFFDFPISGVATVQDYIAGGTDNATGNL
jgi:hypothetical protein